MPRNSWWDEFDPYIADKCNKAVFPERAHVPYVANEIEVDEFGNGVATVSQWVLDFHNRNATTSMYEEGLEFDDHGNRAEESGEYRAAAPIREDKLVGQGRSLCATA